MSTPAENNFMFRVIPIGPPGHEIPHVAIFGVPRQWRESFLRESFLDSDDENGTALDGEQHTTWHHPMLHQDFTEFSPIAPGQSHGQQILGGGGASADSALPSPPITVSGSELSSPAGGSASPPQLQRSSVPPPPPMPGGRKSPYEWMRKPSYQSQPNPGKTRTKDKYRVVYTDHQRLELEKEFHYSRYITIRRKAELAASLGLSERQVKIWFQNRRAKERKQVKKREELTQKEFKVEPGTGTHEAMIATAQAHSGFHHQSALHQNMAAVAANLHQHAHQLHHHQLHQPPMHQLCSPD